MAVWQKARGEAAMGGNSADAVMRRPQSKMFDAGSLVLCGQIILQFNVKWRLVMLLSVVVFVL